MRAGWTETALLWGWGAVGVAGLTGIACTNSPAGAPAAAVDAKALTDGGAASAGGDRNVEVPDSAAAVDHNATVDTSADTPTSSDAPTGEDLPVSTDGGSTVDVAPGADASSSGTDTAAIPDGRVADTAAEAPPSDSGAADVPPLVPGKADDYPYVSDLGDGTYRNPVILADYSDPDPIRVGDDYYLIASSFNWTPGLPILHSRDLVNWTLAGHALANLSGSRFSQPQSGQGVWAPSIRVHGGVYYIAYPNYCKPADDGACAEEGIWVVTAPSPLGPWSQPRQLLAARGVIDPCLFWDDDGKAYLVHAYANSRAGISDRVDIRPLNADATQTTGTGQMVFSDPTNHPTLEGPKMYKRNGWYYILAPAGGVPKGWQLALRSKSVYGPYEAKKVLEQGATAINGPHQGGLVDTPDGSEWWFLHFQDAGAYGRVVHLNPVTWTDDWPLMGTAGSGGIRQPVTTYKKPALPKQAIAIPATSDDFDGESLGLQWQWSANHKDGWYALGVRAGYLRLFPQNVAAGDLAQAPNLLTQKVPARSFTVETQVELSGTGASRSGLVLWGDPPTALTVEESGSALKISLISNGSVVATDTVAKGPARLRVAFSTGAVVRFSYGPAEGALKSFSQSIQMGPRKGGWVGVKVGLFAIAADSPAPSGYADFSYFRFSGYAAP